MRNKNKKKLIIALNAINIVRKEPVKLKHAGGSTVYIDIKKAYGYPYILDILCKLMHENINKKINCVAASGYGGLPLAGAMATKYKLHLILVREKPKTHGRNTWIDGYEPKAEDRVWIIDDVFTTGKSINQMIRVLKLAKAKVVGCSVVVRRSNKNISIPCKHILTMKELS